MILQRYITKEIIKATLAVLLVLTLLMVGGRLIRYFGMAAQGGLDIGVVLTLVGYKLLAAFELIFPLSFFIALMLVFGRLYVDYEMTVIKSAGMSPRRLAVSLWPFMLCMVLLQAGLTLVAKPWGLYSAEKLQQEQAVRSAFDLVQPGKFISSNGYNLYVGDFSKDKRELLDVMLIQRDQRVGNQKKARDIIILAKRAAQVGDDEVAAQMRLHNQPAQASADQTPAKPDTTSDTNAAQAQVVMLDLFNGRRYEVGENNLAYNQVAFSQYRITLEQPSKDNQDDLEIEAQSTFNLIKRLPNQVALAELGFRLSLPLVMLLALILAVPLSKVNPRQGRWVKVLPSILLFATSVVALMSLKGSVAKGKVPVVTYLAVVLLYVIFAVYVYNKNKVHQRVKKVVQDVRVGGS